VKLTVLGCSGSVPGPDSPASGYLIEADGFRVVLDLGNGTYGALQRYVDPATVDAIVLSHLHPDHCIDMTSYIVALRHGKDRPAHRLPVIAPSGARDRIGAAFDPLARKLGLHELFDFATPRAGELGPFSVSFASVNHPVATFAIRLGQGDRSLVYSADTGVSDALVSLAKGADVLLCEASIGPDEPDFPPDLHLTGRQAGEHATRAGVGRLLITHVPPWHSREVAAAEAGSTFAGPVAAVNAGQQFDI
jgi:ribonuclease BN (tRNA processing enzyme)